jgi:hypothetical protein
MRALGESPVSSFYHVISRVVYRRFALHEEASACSGSGLRAQAEASATISDLDLFETVII